MIEKTVPEMSEAAKEARREYLRQWRRAHPENTRKHKADYWERKAAQAAQTREANQE